MIVAGWLRMGVVGRQAGQRVLSSLTSLAVAPRQARSSVRTMVSLAASTTVATTRHTHAPSSVFPCSCHSRFFSAQALPASDADNDNDRTMLTASGRPLNPRKVFLTKRIDEAIVNSTFAGIVRHAALNAEEWAQLRYDLRQQNLGITIIPNGVTRKYLEIKGLPDALTAHFEGHTAVVFSKDDMPFADFKKLEKHPKLELVAAFADARVLGVNEVDKYADIPSLDALRGQLLTVMQQPMMVLKQVLTSNQSRLVYALGQVASPDDAKDE
ncbi:hypothetical protein PTSG_05499 [Salpingoeca rosetta]|uniref:50S ribosomal protein L10 n=1 Tax=Salpingoeca rosetta (strain ATCC 50818 / BSB-021) TaxID=946362 RepID=F2UBE0_SALR5|nr:uncharacterized protein PTSG_05499 [Salpingoeca rosetta]EGD73806.1 hypothetical protein PTSG_05499 [Salpingoeca rosetta]|eukprot:XP_004993369.1 hypothetical protein PTSG_05499 [Salpingoeca rosetta]